MLIDYQNKLNLHATLKVQDKICHEIFIIIASKQTGVIDKNGLRANDFILKEVEEQMTRISLGCDPHIALEIQQSGGSSQLQNDKIFIMQDRQGSKKPDRKEKKKKKSSRI